MEYQNNLPTATTGSLFVKQVFIGDLENIMQTMDKKPYNRRAKIVLLLLLCQISA